MRDALFKLLFCDKDDWLWWSPEKCHQVFMENYAEEFKMFSGILRTIAGVWDAQKDAA